MIKNVLCVAALSCSLAGTASAGTIEYFATSAQSDTVKSDFHSLWSKKSISGLGKDFHFDPAGIFALHGDGSGSLTGKVFSALDDMSGWHLSFEYSDDLSDYGPDGPRFKDEQGSQAIQDEVGDNFFLSLVGGTLTGFGSLMGADFNVSAMPKPTNNTFAVQVGTGSNNKNGNYGLANWFFFNRAEGCEHTYCSILDGEQGDINVDLEAVPLPLPAVLLLAGLGSLAGMRRFQK